ncbi:MAG: DNA topoisomerase III [Pedobacter sp.]|nr:MAG: DNA topoisomerase III [Pedobacter sp.]
MKVILAEKPSVARDLAKVFGATTRKDGYIEGKGYTFTWAFGHLLQLAPPQEYGFYGWRKEHLPIVPQKFKLAIRKIKTKDGMVEDPGVRKQLDIIQKLFDEATEIIVATDAGREGELIFRYIYYYLKCKKPFRRLWISSQTDEAIKAGFKSLKPGSDYDSLFNSAHCRSESDWLVGMNATQALSISAGGRNVLSLGRVQTPTLAMICTRYLENKNFVPQTYYQLALALGKVPEDFTAISVQSFIKKEEAEAILKDLEELMQVQQQLAAQVTQVEAKPRKEAPPLLHDLSSIQQEANKKKGLTADQTLQIMQNLYESKLISYPRTGSRYIGDDIFATIPALIEKFNHHDQFGRSANQLNGSILNKRSVNAKKVTDHHAILPTGESGKHLSGDHKLIYDLIVGRMLEAFSPECLKEITKIKIHAITEFVANGTVIKSAGWRAVFNDPEEDNKEEDNKVLPLVKKGDVLFIETAKLLDKQTKPKPLYNEASLLKALETSGKDIEDEELREAMKDTGLGTPATRAAIIETLLTREYIIREKRNLVPTRKGLAVYEVVKEKQIAQAELTGQWEKRLEEIRAGASVHEFKQEIIAYTKTITQELLISGIQLAKEINPKDLHEA